VQARAPAMAPAMASGQVRALVQAQAPARDSVQASARVQAPDPERVQGPDRAHRTETRVKEPGRETEVPRERLPPRLRRRTTLPTARNRRA
jgi:hypothetical protein